MSKLSLSYLLFVFLLLTASCSKSTIITSNPPVISVDTTTVAFNINSIEDTYADLAPFDYYSKWGSYNVHDPSIRKFGDYYYCYSTDVGYGITVRPGIQIRKSKDLVQWTFVGWVFNSIPPMAAKFITDRGGTPYNALWAPFVMKVGGEYRLYFALSCSTPRLSVIGLATSTNPTTGWTEKGIVVTSEDNTVKQTNAIDPTVIVTPSGAFWMYYGSAWDGIYALQLDPTTGLPLVFGDKGVRIANRGYTNGQYNGNIEAPEVVYNSTLQKYYLFISYDWLQTKYNVRVCRADNPQGPYYDFNGVDANTDVDHGPMIEAPYQFVGHGGWQGTAHCTVFDDGNGNYFMANQARPTVNSYFMDLHVRKIFWTTDGWPVVSPERYAWEDNSTVPKDSLIGTWQRIVLNYKIVPGYATTQTDPNLQVAISLTISANGTLNNSATNTWAYNAPWLQFNWSDGTVDKVFVQQGHDWEKTGRPMIFIFSGLNNKGTAIWGKKVSN